MGIFAKLKFMSPLPLSKIYPKNQLKSIGKNSFFCASIGNCESSTIDAKKHGELTFAGHPRWCGVCLNHETQESNFLHLQLKRDARRSETKLNTRSIAHLIFKFIGFGRLSARAKNSSSPHPAKIKKSRTPTRSIS